MANAADLSAATGESVQLPMTPSPTASPRGDAACVTAADAEPHAVRGRRRGVRRRGPARRVFAGRADRRARAGLHLRHALGRRALPTTRWSRRAPRTAADLGRRRADLARPRRSGVDVDGAQPCAPADAVPLRHVDAGRRPGRELVGRRAPGAQAERPRLGAVADGGRRWTRPTVIPMPIPGSAEAPGPLTGDRPRSLDRLLRAVQHVRPVVVVDRNQIVAVFSDDDGRTWRHTSMLRFADPDAGGAEAWVVELVGRPARRHVLVDEPRDRRRHADPVRALVRPAATRGRRRGRRASPARRRRWRPCATAASSWATTSVRSRTRASGSRSPDPTDDDFGVGRLGPAWLAEHGPTPSGRRRGRP